MTTLDPILVSNGATYYLPAEHAAVLADEQGPAFLVGGFGTDRIFGPAYRANLAHDWIRSREGVSDKLLAGATVADFGDRVTFTCCPPASLSQPGRCGLGAQAGLARLREVLGACGFQTVRRATETPFNRMLEAKA